MMSVIPISRGDFSPPCERGSLRLELTHGLLINVPIALVALLASAREDELRGLIGDLTPSQSKK